MVTYESTYNYITASTNLLTRINRMQALIDAFELAILANATSAHLQDYSLDDGQSKISTGYRSMKELTDGIAGLDLLLQRLIVRHNKLNTGSVIRMIDSKNMRQWL